MSVIGFHFAASSATTADVQAARDWLAAGLFALCQAFRRYTQPLFLPVVSRPRLVHSRPRFFTLSTHFSWSIVSILLKQWIGGSSNGSIIARSVSVVGVVILAVHKLVGHLRRVGNLDRIVKCAETLLF